MIPFVTRSKTQGEVITLAFHFDVLLVSGETLVSATIAVTESTGTDTNPSAILTGGLATSGNIISQLVQQGIPGLIYEAVVTAVTSANRKLSLGTLLEVQPNNTAATPVYTLVYDTSNLYVPPTPGNIYYVSFSDSLGVTTGINSSAIPNTDLVTEGDSIGLAQSILSASLVAPPVAREAESLGQAFAIVNGTLQTVAVGTFPTDSIGLGHSILSGTLV